MTVDTPKIANVIIAVLDLIISRLLLHLSSFEKDPRVDESRAGPLSQRHSPILRRRRRGPWEERKDRGKQLNCDKRMGKHLSLSITMSCGFEPPYS